MFLQTAQNVVFQFQENNSETYQTSIILAKRASSKFQDWKEEVNYPIMMHGQDNSYFYSSDGLIVFIITIAFLKVQFIFLTGTLGIEKYQF